MGWLYVCTPCNIILSVFRLIRLDLVTQQTFMGVILGSAVVPIALCISWSKANKWGCVLGAVSGFFSGIIAWLVTTSSLNNNIINVTVRYSTIDLTHMSI